MEGDRVISMRGRERKRIFGVIAHTIDMCVQTVRSRDYVILRRQSGSTFTADSPIDFSRASSTGS